MRYMSIDEPSAEISRSLKPSFECLMIKREGKSDYWPAPMRAVPCF